MSRGIVPAVPRGQQIAQGLLSGSTLLLVAVGVPVVLVLVGGSPVPHGLVHAVRVDMSLRQLFGKPVADTWIVHAAFALAWCAWLWLSVCVVVEMVSWVSGRTPARVPGSRAMQALAACLVGTTLAVMSANRIPGPSAHVTPAGVGRRTVECSTSRDECPLTPIWVRAGQDTSGRPCGRERHDVAGGGESVHQDESEPVASSFSNGQHFETVSI